MSKTIRSFAIMAIFVSITWAAGFAQSSGEAVYKAKCQNCHGVTGMADTAVGKALKVKPVSDPAVLKFTNAAMIDATRNGMGKMQSFKDKLTDAEIRAAVAYFRSLAK
jgi:mono/diheme cytochrome c family protein